MPMIERSTALHIYRMANAQLHAAEQQVSDCTYRLKEAQTRVEHWHRVTRAFETEICPSCHGQGEVRNIIAQDESRIETCPRCKGSGLALTKERP